MGIKDRIKDSAYDFGVGIGCILSVPLIILISYSIFSFQGISPIKSIIISMIIVMIFGFIVSLLGVIKRRDLKDEGEWNDD